MLWTFFSSPYTWLVLPVGMFTAFCTAGMLLFVNIWRDRTRIEGVVRIKNLRAIWAPYSADDGQNTWQVKVVVDICNQALVPLKIRIAESYVEIGSRVPALPFILNKEGIIPSVDSMEFKSGAIVLDDNTTPISGRLKLKIEYGDKELKYISKTSWLLYFERDEYGAIQVRAVNDVE